MLLSHQHKHLFRTKPSLGLSDCLMLEMARKAGDLPLGTFDRNSGKVGGAQKLEPRANWKCGAIGE